MFKKKANYQIISKRNEKSFKKENGDSNKFYQKKNPEIESKFIFFSEIYNKKEKSKKR
jgi:hypothetical protein